ncbi:hypothetical protein CLOBL_30590 [Clostridium sp. BL-8]|nr:hypothetical protein CLOBL_30590 [Clostridium sp. BL-8]
MKNKIVLVTGAISGIGKATAITLKVIIGNYCIND